MDINFGGLILGASTFVIIGVFHPIVIKAEYHFGVRCWWVFAVAGVAFSLLSLFVCHYIVSTILGVLSFSCFWSILEVFDQRKRVQKGWFPKNPKRAADYEEKR